MQDPKPIPTQSRKATPEERAWHEYLLRAQQETPKRLEDAAKFLATIAGLSLTLFVAAGGQSGLLQGLQSTPVKAAVVLWLLSLLCAFFVLFPWHYRYASPSAQAIAKMHRKIIRVKDTLLILSMALYLGALVLLAWVVFL